eukprot:Unigene10840_Nuclearia_a/m.33094 Unigene10840_Nuclearia_a/g.33094  ORF Unigene10840_Nuclearia_a/g.33094 Unigene10840_Nuclearia_a/m.33094 type:complete len:138 (+) Unigene10840_Nuclearia_a:102-515(+)
MSHEGWLAALRRWAKALKRDVHALYLAMWDARLQTWRHLAVRVVMAATVAYALSPIDLIPDFIPVLGLLDDLLIVPLGVWLSIQLIPAPVWADCTQRAAREMRRLDRNWAAGAVVVLIWLVAGTALARVLWTRLAPA